MSHFALQYIGKPYLLGGLGPDAYDCWGLARAVLSHAGHDLPELSVGETHNATVLRSIVDEQGWRRVDDQPRPFDAVLCLNAYGRHIAVCIEANGRAQYIHADNVAGVEVLRGLDDFARRGYSQFEVWRHGD